VKRIHITRAAQLISVYLLAQSAFPAAFQLYELGTPVIGTAAVGQAAVSNDASTSYFNPAGMTQLGGSQFMLGSQVMLPYTNFGIGAQNTISGNNGGNAASLIPGVDFYYMYSFTPKFKLGVSLTAPYGGMLNYNDGWVGRYIVQDMSFYTLNLNPAIAYNINNYVSIGGGVSVEYANLTQSVALPLLPSIDGQANIKASDFAPGFNLGILLTPTDTTKIGLAYRSQISHNLHGTTTFLRISDTPNTTTKMVMPQNVILSLDQIVTSRFNIVGEAGWSNWASMQNTIVRIDNYTATTIENWSNTYRLGLGGQYHATPAMILQAGIGYDSSPTTTSRRTPNLPMDRQIRVGLGINYAVMQAVKLGFSYEYINFGNAPINNSSTNGVLAGSYSRNYANVFQASINASC